MIDMPQLIDARMSQKGSLTFDSALEWFIATVSRGLMQSRIRKFQALKDKFSAHKLYNDVETMDDPKFGINLRLGETMVRCLITLSTICIKIQRGLSIGTAWGALTNDEKRAVLR